MQNLWSFVKSGTLNDGMKIRITENAKSKNKNNNNKKQTNKQTKQTNKQNKQIKNIKHELVAAAKLPVIGKTMIT